MSVFTGSATTLLVSDSVEFSGSVHLCSGKLQYIHIYSPLERILGSPIATLPGDSSSFPSENPKCELLQV